MSEIKFADGELWLIKDIFGEKLHNLKAYSIDCQEEILQIHSLLGKIETILEFNQADIDENIATETESK